jgi:predicted AAA+ superfamily ATPase
MIQREFYLQQLRTGLLRNPVVALLGPRQCGKTTLAKALLREESGSYFDLEDPATAATFAEPMSTLAGLRGLVVIDEAQRLPGLFPVLRVLADRDGVATRFLVLGSASPELSRQSAESLAGRVEILELRGFSLDEVGRDDIGRLWLRGGFPRSFLARSAADSRQWRRDFTRTFLERDLAGLGFGMSPAAMSRFWTMLSHYHGQLWNGNEIASSMGVSPHTVRKYLDALEQTFMVRRLLPWHASVGKRLVKSPKIYFRDSGIFHFLQGITEESRLLAHPKLGASWEGFALEETLHALQPDEAWFYAVHSGSELDLLIRKDGRTIGIECKRQDAPRLTRSMAVAMADLNLDELWVVYPGDREYALGDRIRVRPLVEVAGPRPKER